MGRSCRAVQVIKNWKLSSSLNGERDTDNADNMRVLCMIMCALLALLCLPEPSHGASYFGDSYCQINAIQDLSSFHLSLQFKTSRRSGLLLLAAGHKDYLALELHNGRLQARMNMGAGETVLTSPPGLQLHNLLDHYVSLTLKESKLTMAVDDLYTTFTPVQGDQLELNIDLGVFLGGVRDIEVEYLSNAIPSLRGCMSNVKFESHQFDILASEATSCHDTKESCSSEFEAADGEATSFISPDSFVSFPTWTRASNGIRTLEILMKTTIEDALLLFHPGHEPDFIALGVVGGYLKGVVDLGSGMMVLDNVKVQLDDDQWHRIRVQIEPSMFEINVDSETVSLALNGSERLDLVGNLYLGGIQGKMKDVFRDGYLTRMEDEITSESFIGCLGEIKVNERDRSLQDALITKDVHVKCEGEDYDYSSYYYEAATTSPPVRNPYVDPDQTECIPTKDTPEAFQNITKLLEITPLLVPEGGEAFIDLNNLSPTIDINAVGIRQSQIIFTLLSDPSYGLVDMNINTRRTKKFTLLDVVNRKIKYLHDGNEKHSDQIQLYVAVYSASYLPDCLKTPKQYILPVEIIPINDIPQLSGGEITVTENGRTRLTPNLIKIVDSDNRCDDLIVTVTSQFSPQDGYLENAQQPGRSITAFTCRQLKDGNIYYVHKGGATAELTLQVSDGDAVSQSTTLNLQVTRPHMSLVTNTGLLLTQGSNSSIGLQNLAVLSHPRNGEIIYNVTQPLRYGELQIITSDGMPKKVAQFRQTDLDHEHLMYICTYKGVLEDTEIENIHFNVHLGQFTLWNNTFLVKIMPTEVRMTKLIPLEIEGVKEKPITHTDFEAVVKGKNVNSASIRYFLLKPPTLGILKLSDRDLLKGDSFTQEDVWNSHVSYVAKVRRNVDMEDEFQFRVFAENQYSPTYAYRVMVRADSNAPTLTNERLFVLEGSESILTKEHLWVQTPRSTDFVYKISQHPEHGRLFRDTPPGEPRFEGAIQLFSSEDLLLNRLIYKHDGSETSDDQFTFLAFEQSRESPIVPAEGMETVKGVFRIEIQSKNDHVPLRVINKTFNVVRNGQRLLTTDDILFKDDDIDFSDSQLVYTRVGILSGSLVSSMDPSQPLYRFTQADLRACKVLFVHHGADQERFQLQVSDGLHKTTALIQVQAGEPYIHVINNTMVVVDHGSTKVLNTSLLGAETNMDVRDDSEIVYEVTLPPSNGRITVSGTGVSQFTQEDLRKGEVSYEHSAQSLRSVDSFGFTVHSKGLSEQGTFRIKIFKQGYRSQPQIITNETTICYEGEHTVIDPWHLRVEQGDIIASEMVFTIKELPRLGHVVRLNNDSDSTVTPALDFIHSFTQEDINQGHILYVANTVQGQDHFTVDISNGFTTVENRQVQVNIVPRIIPIKADGFTLREGSVVALSEHVLNVTHPFYRSANIEFSVEEPPQHGSIHTLDGSEDELSVFTWSEIQQGMIHYLHDSSETTEDNFTLRAFALDINRRSLPITITVKIIPVNDEPPRLLRNTGLEVLEGEESEITTDVLNAEDLDTPPEKLVYSIEAPSNGMVALKVSPNDNIDNFTQAQINNGEIIFIHQGPASGGFSFTVTDGDHTSPLHRFVVTARELTITMETQSELMVFPGTRQVIGSDILRAVTSEDGDEIRYSIFKPPRLGRVIKSNQKGRFEELTKFAQTDVDSGTVYYEHQMPDEPFWVVRDSIELILSSPPASDVRYILPIIVSYYAANRNVSSQLWKNKGLDIVQGQSKVIDRSILDASNLLASLPKESQANHDVVFEIRRFPTRGRLVLGDSDLSRDNPYFLQEDVNNRELEYFHSDSGASTDSFSFRVRLNPSGQSQPAQSGVVLEEIFLISVRRRDSNPPELVSLDLLLEALQGSTTVLSTQHLNTSDQDSTPDEVRFIVTKSPTNGRLIYFDTGDHISQFTQEDINNGRVAFVSDGTLEDGFMEFSVSDGKHHTGPHTLHIGILAKRLILSKAQEIQVKQGDDETLITESMLSATTGGPIEEEVLYKITNVPKYAAVMVDRQPTSAFTQKQIKEGRVSVRFIKSTSPRDTVSFVARSRAANVSSTLNITVKPLAHLARDPLLPQGATVLVDRTLLDATPLVNKTRASATFTVIRQPLTARFVSRGELADGQPVDSFTQRDLDEGRVALEILNSTSGQPGEGQIQDEAHFMLKAHGVPPAECVLSFTTAPYSPSETYGAKVLKIPPKVSKPDKDNVGSRSDPRARGDVDWPYGVGPTTHSPNKGSHKTPVSRRNTLWAILIPILVILLLLFLAGLLAYYLVRRNKTGKHNVQTVAAKPKNGEVSQETFRKTDPANNIPMSNMDSKEADPELLQHCRTANPALKKNQYWV
ncbi:chondroitin sulfate proteoglycan 4 [Chanos chanos]|uniref:Chondroitin sulfate proteoglycan 4 n=1 Tax=Chanos chanos TaxID=29144 RepID=A0A6J2W762_CHACN|nr:chondroitin sulfate proteoglycan 4 [Chanos chanos]